MKIDGWGLNAKDPNPHTVSGFGIQLKMKEKHSHRQPYNYIFFQLGGKVVNQSIFDRLGNSIK